MLVLSRKSGESLLIDRGRIEVRVLRIKGARVELGITAPRETDIVREEICQWSGEDGSSDQESDT